MCLKDVNIFKYYFNHNYPNLYVFNIFTKKFHLKNETIKKKDILAI